MSPNPLREPIDQGFLRGLSTVLQLFFSGLYYDAKQAAERLQIDVGEPHSPIDFEPTVAHLINRFMETWDSGLPSNSVKRLIEAGASDEAFSSPWLRLRLFYSLMLAAWTGSAETRNLDTLMTAHAAATKAAQMLHEDFWQAEPIQGFLADLPRIAPYVPPPWAAPWFRARIRIALMRHVDAVRDLNSVIGLLTPDVHEYWEKLLGGKLDPNSIRQLIDPLAPLQGYGRDRGRLIGRFLHDAALVSFELGDWGGDESDGEYTTRPAWSGTEQLLVAAANIDEDNPYILASLGFFFNYSYREADALATLQRVHELLEKRRLESAASHEWYASGRMYFHMAVLALKYRHRANEEVMSIQRRERLNDKVEELRGSGLAKIISEPNGAEFLAQLSREYYEHIREGFSALPAAILALDPLAAPDVASQVRASRKLLWQLLYGMGTDLISNLNRLDNLLRQHFALGLPIKEDQ